MPFGSIDYMVVMETTKGKKANNKALVTKQQVKAMLDSTLKENMELKYYDTSDSATGIGFSGFASSLCTPAQGDTDTTRDGDRIHIERVWFHYGWSNGDNTNVVRVILFQWFPNSAPAVSDILLHTGSAQAPWSDFNWDNRQEYKILYDKTWYLSAYYNGGAKVKGLSKPLIIKNGFRRNLQFQAGATTGTNQIYKLILSDSGAVPNPLFNSWSRIEFTDS